MKTMFALAALLLGAGLSVQALTNPAPRPGGFDFDGKISRPVLENYLARAICMQGMMDAQDAIVDDDIRMLTNCGAKYIARGLCLWNAERNFLSSVERAKAVAPKIHAADPEIVIEGCVFETVSAAVNRIAVPDWVFTDMGRPVEQRNFVYTNMIYTSPRFARSMGAGAQVPDENRPETQLWFYYQAATYIDLGCEGLHFGQVEIMNHNDHGNTNWLHLLTLVRKYAATHARRHMVLCNGHVPGGGLQHDGNPLLDFNAFPLRVKEAPELRKDTNGPMEAVLAVGYTDALFLRSKGGMTVNGWSCEHLPYLVELDNWGQSRNPGHPKQGGNFVWGYDEISWFGHLPHDYQAHWLQYGWDWVRTTDPNGYMEMPGSRTASTSKGRWYYANNPSDVIPNGQGDEAAIRNVWAGDSAKLMKDGN